MCRCIFFFFLAHWFTLFLLCGCWPNQLKRMLKKKSIFHYTALRTYSCLCRMSLICIFFHYGRSWPVSRRLVHLCVAVKMSHLHLCEVFVLVSQIWIYHATFLLCSTSGCFDIFFLKKKGCWVVDTWTQNTHRSRSPDGAWSLSLHAQSSLIRDEICSLCRTRGRCGYRRRRHWGKLCINLCCWDKVHNYRCTVFMLIYIL